MDYRQHFIERANTHHSNKYDYSKFIYVTAKTPSTIICPIHGEFQQKPDHHIRKNSIGCPKCVSIRRLNGIRAPKRLYYKKTPEEFLQKAHAKFSDKFEYDLSTYVGFFNNKIRIKCPVHGWFNKLPKHFLISRFGCTKCGKEHASDSKTKSYSNFVENAHLLYNHKYTYPVYNKDTYINRHSIVDIICPTHGLFRKRGNKHLSGQGCFKCNIQILKEQSKLSGGYNKTFFNNHNNANISGVLYYMNINNRYYKIGITTDIKRRISGLKSVIRKTETTFNIECKVIKTGSISHMYDKEQYILDYYSKYRIDKYGSSEFFCVDISKDESFQEIIK